jgi:streptogramin lyase
LAATINGPRGIAVEDDGTVFVTELKGLRVRRIDARTGVVSTVAGNGKRCCFDENSPATESALRYPVALSIDNEHNLYIGDTSARIKRVETTTGRVSIVVREKSDPLTVPFFDDGETLAGLAVNPKDSTGTIYAVGRLGHIYRIRDGSIAIMPVFDRSVSITNPQSGPFMDAFGVAVDATENLFIADYENCRIMRVESGTGNLAVVAGTGECKPSEDGGTARLTSIEHPTAIAIHPNGDVYFATPDTQSCIRRIDHKT